MLGAASWLLNNPRKISYGKYIHMEMGRGTAISSEKHGLVFKVISRGDVGWEIQLHSVPDAQPLVVLPSPVIPTALIPSANQMHPYVNLAVEILPCLEA